MVKKLFDKYCNGCRESKILTTLSEALYFIAGVAPHRAHTRHRLDRFYLFLWFFNIAYMITLILGYLYHAELKEWHVNFIAYPVLLTYAGSVGLYMKENFREKERGNDKKKRAGHIIVIAWIGLTLSLSVLAIVGNNEYNTILRTTWEIAVITLIALRIAKRKSEEIKEQNENNHSNNIIAK